MQSEEIRRRFLTFFEKRGHVVIPSASLVPENDSSVLFTTAGMQPLVPYLLGKKHPQGRRLVNIQKCVRTQDINEVGDNTHDTFFEMLGNWSLGDYFKEEAIQWSYELLTNREEGFGLDPKRLYITVFEGDENAPKDEEAFQIWQNYMPKNHIFFMGAKSNWWSVGENGPCGPDTEMFYDVTSSGLGDLTKKEYEKADAEQKVVEVWNDVFMEYEKKDGQITNKLSQRNVDTGAGLERLTMALQKKNNIFNTDLFISLISVLDKFTSDNIRSKRIIVDHIRTSVFMIADGVLPSNTGRGYILRRLLRRAYVHVRKIEGDFKTVISVVNAVVSHESYKGLYAFNSETEEIISMEISKFGKTLESGLKQFDKGVDPFTLFTSYGFPIELTEELAHEKGITINRAVFDKEMRKHRTLSRSGGERKFKR